MLESRNSLERARERESINKSKYFGHLMRRVDSLEKTLMLGGTGGRRRRGLTEDEMAGCHH